VNGLLRLWSSPCLLGDGGPSGRTHIGSLTRVMARRMEGEEEEEEGVQKTLFLSRINF